MEDKSTLKHLIIVLLTFLGNLVIAQDFYVRYNQAGYSTEGKKSLIINAEKSLKNNKWQIFKNDSLVLSGELGQSITGKGDHTNFDFNYKIDFSRITQKGKYRFVLNDNSYELTIDANPYSKYISDVLRYLRQQRSGSFESIDRAPGHFQDSAALIYNQVGDKMEWVPNKEGKKANLLGGWYDAGDYLKFTLTSAYTTYNLLRAYEENPKAFDFKTYSKSDLNDLLDEAKFGLDYLQQCLINDSTFVIQVGDNRDHELGDRLPADDTNEHRYAYCSMSRTHLAFNAAVFATAGRVFKSVDTSLSKSYLQHSEHLFELAMKHKVVYWFQKGHEIFYADKSPFDNIVLAAAELARSTGKKQYEEQVQYYSSMAGRAYWASWSDFNMIAHGRAGKFYNRSLNYMISDLEDFEKIAMQPNNVWMVPHEYTWGSLYSFFGVASAGIIHDQINNEKRFGYLAQEVIDYTFGKNNWGVSFLASEQLPNSVQNIYSQTYKLQPKLFPTGGIAEGPGDMEGHLENVKWFSLSREAYKSDKFNTQKVVFFDDATDFQTMETTIGGLADGIFLLSLITK